MFGVIAWIRADGRKALVVVEGSSQMAAGDPGMSRGQSLTVGDLVYLPDISADMSEFGAGLQLVRSEFWPQIRREIFQMATSKSSAASQIHEAGGNVVSLFAMRDQAAAHRSRRSRSRIVAAE